MKKGSDRQKIPFYRNGLVIGLVVTVLGFILYVNKTQSASSIGAIGMLIVVITLVVRVFRWIKDRRHNTKEQPAPITQSIENNESVSSPDALEAIEEGNHEVVIVTTNGTNIDRDERRIGVITFGIDSNGKPYASSVFDKQLNMSEGEEAIASHCITLLRQRRSALNVTIERRADAYLSMLCNGITFLRFKYGARAHWISICAIGTNGMIFNENDIRFSAQHNKNDSFWRINITDLTSLEEYDDLILAACDEVHKMTHMYGNK